MALRSHFVCALVLFLGSASGLQAINIDFSFEDDGVTPLQNGQKIDVGQEFGTLFDVSGSGSNSGVAIFDTTACPGGVNCGGPDPDLLVGLGNALILQENSGNAGNLTGDFFDVANDDASQNNRLFFDFFSPITALSLDLIDINGNGPAHVTLEDQNGLTRTYSASMHWTYDISVSGPKGFETLDLTTLVNQPGEGGGVATAVEDAGFNPNDVIKITVLFEGSGAVDNLNFVPEPATFVLLAIGGAICVRRRKS